ncbi:hypothetical protein C8Q75DRAFT_807711 [Abortiporus biennis]|nr:hypothetical protein C8Q75DRAFT_807711 [Abortiporus biennis]
MTTNQTAPFTLSQSRQQVLEGTPDGDKPHQERALSQDNRFDTLQQDEDDPDYNPSQFPQSSQESNDECDIECHTDLDGMHGRTVGDDTEDTGDLDLFGNQRRHRLPRCILKSDFGDTLLQFFQAKVIEDRINGKPDHPYRVQEIESLFGCNWEDATVINHFMIQNRKRMLHSWRGVDVNEAIEEEWENLKDDVLP